MNDPTLAIPCNFGQSADTAVLAYVRERMNLLEVAAGLLPASHEERFIWAMQGIFADLLKDGEQLLINRTSERTNVVLTRGALQHRDDHG